MRKIFFFGFLIAQVLLRFSRCSDLLEPFELDEFLNGNFVNRGFSGNWISGNTFLYTNTTSRDVYEFNAETLTSKVFFSSDVLSDYPSSSYTLSGDQNFILIRYNPKAVFRHSTIAQFAIYDLNNLEYYDVADKNHIQYAQWDPVGSSLVYVFDNNVFYVSSPSEAANPVKITEDGEPEVVYNGVPDWVYEEEVLSSGSALWFSPDGKKLAFAHFNDTQVPEFNYFIYGDIEPVVNQYPDVIHLRYPKVNATNPDFELRVVNLETPTSYTTLDILPPGAASRDYVLFDVTWATNDEVVAVVENRVQNAADVRRCLSSNTACPIEKTFEEPNGWLEFQAPKYSTDGQTALIILSQPEGDDAYAHLVEYSVASGEFRRLTHGRRVVTSISGWDQVNNVVYYSGSREDEPSQQHVYKIYRGNLTDECITCAFLTPEGFCRYGAATFSKDFSYFAEVCQGLGPNYVVINKPSDLTYSHIYEENAQLRNQLASKARPIISDYTVPVAGGFLARARLLLPPGLDLNDPTVKYPMVVNVYGGPNSNQISDRFSTGFQNYIVTNRRYIYAYIDGRGSGRKGNNMLYQINRRMATVEIEDQIAVTKCLRDDLPFIDPDRIGIWGWSYGGFATAWVLATDSENVFRFGLSVAPVTDFKLYDTIYTERYMGLLTEDDNLIGYNNTDVTWHVEGFRNKLFYLIHGNADDNVHYQQSMLLAKALEHADILFQQMSYPDENHALGGVSPHLYHTIDRFWARSFGLPDPHYRNVTLQTTPEESH